MLIEKENELKNKFIDIIIEADSFICCRATPKQKADIVKMVKSKN